jgi:DNA-binding NarL/FixJ family response regulator
VRILIVDDHEAVRKGVCAILSSRLDIEICGEAVNGKEAIDKAKTLRPDLVILDITMPVLNGFDAAREILKILPQTLIIMLSTHLTNQLVAQAKSSGAKGYVTKTQAGGTLLQAVDSLLNNNTFYPDPA